MKLSIITVNYNNKSGLQKTIESVINQTFSDYEYIIIDGGSIDGSQELIKKYTEKITYWISEPDKGIYNAMNKGIRKAKGEYFIFLNSGDIFFGERTLEEVFKNNFNNADIVYGAACFLKNKEKKIIQFPEKLSLSFFMNDMICHQAMFFNKIFFSKYGEYNENYKLASDWILVFKALYLNANYLKINSIICLYDGNGKTSTIEGVKLLTKERRMSIDIEFPFIEKEIKELDKIKHELEAIRGYLIIRILKWIRNNCFGKKCSLIFFYLVFINVN